MGPTVWHVAWVFPFGFSYTDRVGGRSGVGGNSHTLAGGEFYLEYSTVGTVWRLGREPGVASARIGYSGEFGDRGLAGKNGGLTRSLEERLGSDSDLHRPAKRYKPCELDAQRFRSVLHGAASIRLENLNRWRNAETGEM